MKLMITIGVLLGGLLGGWIGGTIDGSGLMGMGFWNITLSGVGSIAGIWAGYKFAKANGL